MTIKEQIKRDFGYDLPISGGLGMSSDAPIILHVGTWRDSSVVISIYCRCIFGANGWYWRHNSSQLVPDNDLVLKISSDVKYVEDEQIITEKRNFYFDISSIDQTKPDRLYDPRVAIESPANLYIPYELGWFHYDNHIINEAEYPGMGVSIAFSAPQSKLTLFLYNKGQPEFILKQAIDARRQEFAAAIHDFELVNNSANLVQSVDEQEYLFNIYYVDDALMVVGISTFNGMFMKFRLTNTNGSESFETECAMDTIIQIILIFRN